MAIRMLNLASNLGLGDGYKAWRPCAGPIVTHVLDVRRFN